MAASTIWPDALDAIWQAIDQKSELAEDGETPIQRRYWFKTNSDTMTGVSPAYSDLNAIAVWPTTISTADYDFRSKEFPIAFTINVWTKDWILPNAMRTWMNVMTAIMEERDETLYPEDTQKINTYLKMATGQYPRIEQASFNREATGDNQNGGKAIRVEARVIVATTKSIYPR